MKTTVTIIIETQLDGTASVTVTTVAEDGGPAQAKSLHLTAGKNVPKEEGDAES